MYGIESDTDEFSERWAPFAVTMLRIVTALLILQHGTAKILGIPATGSAHPAMWSLAWVSGWVELVGGLLLLVGLGTRWVALALAVGTAIAYYLGHSEQSMNPLLNHGESAALLFFVLLALAAIGAGEWSFDKVIAARRTGIEGYEAPGGERSLAD